MKGFILKGFFEGYHKLAEQNVKGRITVHFKELSARVSAVNSGKGAYVLPLPGFLLKKI